MLTINGRKIMNIEEAVQWLLENNALPFQCKADYAADTVISMSEIVNPSPTEIKVGAVVYFHDCKIATVTGITSNGFTVGSDHIDMRANLFSGDITTDGDITVGEDLYVDGDAKIFEDIVDKDGHKRFIEGNIEMATVTGVTPVYAKWSLSGSHLMIVLVFTGDETTPEGLLTGIELPEWINAKIQAFSNTWVDIRDIVAFSSNNTNQDVRFITTKTYNGLNIFMYGPLTAERYVRYQLDLLIDNE